MHAGCTEEIFTCLDVTAARCAVRHFDYSSIVDKLKDAFVETKLEGYDDGIYTSFTEVGMERPR